MSTWTTLIVVACGSPMPRRIAGVVNNDIEPRLQKQIRTNLTAVLRQHSTAIRGVPLIFSASADDNYRPSNKRLVSHVNTYDAESSARASCRGWHLPSRFFWVVTVSGPWSRAARTGRVTRKFAVYTLMSCCRMGLVAGLAQP